MNSHIGYVGIRERRDSLFHSNRRRSRAHRGFAAVRSLASGVVGTEAEKHRTCGHASGCAVRSDTYYVDGMRYADPKGRAMNSVDLIVLGLTGLIVLALASFGGYKLHRRHTRQQRCYEALRIPCRICGAFRGSTCVDKDGTPIFLHWSRVATSFQSEPHPTR